MKLSNEIKELVAQTESIMSALREIEEANASKTVKFKIDPDLATSDYISVKAEDDVSVVNLEGLAALGKSELKSR
jgi:hypothetical protein